MSVGSGNGNIFSTDWHAMDIERFLSFGRPILIVVLLHVFVAGFDDILKFPFKQKDELEAN